MTLVFIVLWWSSRACWLGATGLHGQGCWPGNLLGGKGAVSRMAAGEGGAGWCHLPDWCGYSEMGKSFDSAVILTFDGRCCGDGRRAIDLRARELFP
jgi:hypothetical protein